LPWVLLVFALTRIYLALFFEPQLTDLRVYFNYAVQGVDLKRTAYKDFAIEYPPVAPGRAGLVFSGWNRDDLVKGDSFGTRLKATRF
jgi:hypothetical protein